VRILVLNNYVDQVKYTRQIQNLSAQVEKNCGAEVDTTVYQDFDAEFVKAKRAKFDAIVMSGSEALYSKDEDKAKFLGAIEATREIDFPLLGICGGHQLIGMAYGERVVGIGKVIKSYKNVELLTDDPLFEGLSKVVSVMESHQDMVERVPRGFQLLARSEDTSIEAFRKPNRVLYGVQFHPERNDAEHPAGAAVLVNFGRLVRQ
jgi:GMP synthase (glutamine-hydrolysing)